MLTPAVCSKCGVMVLLVLPAPPKTILWFKCPVCAVRVQARKPGKTKSQIPMEVGG